MTEARNRVSDRVMKLRSEWAQKLGTTADNVNLEYTIRDALANEFEDVANKILKDLGYIREEPVVTPRIPLREGEIPKWLAEEMKREEHQTIS